MIFSFLQRIVGNVNYPKDPVAAIRGAFEDTDLIFLEKGQSEVRQLNSSNGLGWCYLLNGFRCFSIVIKVSQLESPGANLNYSFMAIKHNVGFPNL